MYKHVLCDFDGTLVDSVDGILRSLRICVERARIAVLIEPSREMIGPPLGTLIEKVIGAGHVARKTIEAAYCAEYDDIGYLSTRPYPGMDGTLLALRAGGALLHLVSNKRRVPVERILGMLNWNGSFASINTLDSTPGASSKSDVVRWLLIEHGLRRDAVLMVGDSLDDQEAAAKNDVAFAWASWGYGQDRKLRDSEVLLGVPMDLVHFALEGRLSAVK
jgi:phosphoglycolate phosphatase